MTKRKLTERQRAFVEEYIVDLNGTQAAIRAGYAERNARTTAAKLLANSNIQERLSKKKSQRSERTKINADYVLMRLTEIDQMDAIDILDDNDNLLPISKWPAIWRQMISGLDIKELYDGSGGERALAGALKKIKWPDKVKNLDLIGKHVDVQAWREQKALTNADGTALDLSMPLKVEFVSPSESKNESDDG